jgi:hypothetical protein
MIVPGAAGTQVKRGGAESSWQRKKPAAVDVIGRTIEAIKANPNSPELHNNLGVLYFKGGRIEEAVESVR